MALDCQLIKLLWMNSWFSSLVSVFMNRKFLPGIVYSMTGGLMTMLKSEFSVCTYRLVLISSGSLSSRGARSSND